MADAISRLDFVPAPTSTWVECQNWMTFTKRWRKFTSRTQNNSVKQHLESMNHVFANRSEDDEIYPLTVKEIAEETLEFVRTYLDDLLCITKGSLEDHLDKLRQVLTRLQDAGLKVNADKSKFCAFETEYLGYILTRDGIKPQESKVQAILALKPPTNVKELRRFLGMVQYYRDLWAKRSEMLAPLTDLVGECGQTKVTKANQGNQKSTLALGRGPSKGIRCSKDYHR